MLSPDARQVAIDLLKPPPGFRLDQAVLTTYSLDLEALLALPLAVLSQTDGGIDELLADPLLLLTALREAGERVHVFVDRGGIAIPRVARPLFAMLEASVHPVRAPNGGAFHPKVWVARFVDANESVLLRVTVLSRNLTFDRSWDVAVASEAKPDKKRAGPRSQGLADLLRTLPRMTTADAPLPERVVALLSDMAKQVEHTTFPSPAGFADSLNFHALGLKKGRSEAWRPMWGGNDVLAIAPFANKTALDTLLKSGDGKKTLLSRQETLDALPEVARQGWDVIKVLCGAAADEPEDGHGTRPSGLHAKIIVIEHGWDVTWFVGSANLTHAAFTGANVEMMASMTGRKGRPEGKSGVGIARFTEAGFLDRLCETYQPRPVTIDPLQKAAEERLRGAQRQLLDAKLCIVCAPAGNAWTWAIRGDVDLPDGVEVAAWPVSIVEDQAKVLPLPLVWNLPETRLSAFAAFRLRATEVGVDEVRFSLKLPTEGMPEGRVAQVLRSLIDSPERLLRYLRALLGGLDGLVDWSTAENAGTPSGRWDFGAGLNGETLLEDLLRVASRDPSRLDTVRKLFEDLRSTDEGRQIVPDELYAVWLAVDRVIIPQGPR